MHLNVGNNQALLDRDYDKESLVHAPFRVFFGHHKCATGWIDGVLREICFHMGIRFKIVHLPVHFLHAGSLGNLVRQERIGFLAYTNAERIHTLDLPPFKGFHVVRDPRDVIVSAYFSHLYSHSSKGWPELEAHRKELQQLSKEEGLFCEMEFSRPEMEQMYDWDYEQENVLELKMEELTGDPINGFIRIVRFLDLLDEREHGGLQRALLTVNLKMNRLNQKGRRFMPGNLPMFPVPQRSVPLIPLHDLVTILEKKSFSRLAGGRKRGQENVKSHYRKGVPGDWKNHFTEAHIRRFKESYNHVLVKLGYETDANW